MKEKIIDIIDTVLVSLENDIEDADLDEIDEKEIEVMTRTIHWFYEVLIDKIRDEME